MIFVIKVKHNAGDKDIMTSELKVLNDHKSIVGLLNVPKIYKRAVEMFTSLL